MIAVPKRIKHLNHMTALIVEGRSKCALRYYIENRVSYETFKEAHSRAARTQAKLG